MASEGSESQFKSTLDLSILINGATSLALSVIFVVIFISFRKAFKWLYYPNQAAIKYYMTIYLTYDAKILFFIC